MNLNSEYSKIVKIYEKILNTEEDLNKFLQYLKNIESCDDNEIYNIEIHFE